MGQTILDVPMKKQLKSQWCWAASAEMIDKFHHRDLSPSTRPNQCAIVNQYLISLHSSASGYGIWIDPSAYPSSLNPSQCCTTCLCNGIGTITPEDFPMPYFHPSFFVLATYHTALLNLGYYSTLVKNMNFSNIKNEIKFCMPLIAGLTYGTASRGAGSHIVVVNGYEETSAGEQILHVLDPMYFDSCRIAEIRMIPLSNLDPDSVVQKMEYYLAGIRPTNLKSCDSCAFKTNPFIENEDNILQNRPSLIKSTEKLMSYSELMLKLKTNEDYIKIPVNYIKQNAVKKFFLHHNYNKEKYIIKQDTDYYYFGEKGSNIITYQKIKGENRVSCVKYGKYPVVFSIKPNISSNNLININLQKETDPPLELYRIYGPTYKEYYFVQLGKEHYFFNPKDYRISDEGKITEPMVPINRFTLRKTLNSALKGLKIEGNIVQRPKSFRILNK